MSDIFCEILKRDLAPNARFVYHYTCVGTLPYILGSFSSDKISLRATNVDYLNDPTEFKTGIELLKTVKLEEGASKDDMGIMLSELERRRKITFSVSMSRMGDSLPMWHMYAPCDGISIGFNYKRILNTIPDEFLPLECFYGEQKVRGYLENLFLADKISYCEFQYCLPYIMKNEAYKHEREIRLIGEFASPDGISFKKGISVPFKKIILDKVAIDRIIIGPTSSESCEKYVLDLLDQHNMGRVKIIRSKIPYRNV